MKLGKIWEKQDECEMVFEQRLQGRQKFSFHSLLFPPSSPSFLSFTVFSPSPLPLFFLPSLFQCKQWSSIGVMESLWQGEETEQLQLIEKTKLIYVKQSLGRTKKYEGNKTHTSLIPLE